MRKRLAFLTSVICMMMFFAAYSTAESRPIYIGDLIQLEIPKSSGDETEIRESFVDFEIVEIEDADEAFLVTLRSFEIGSKTVTLNGQDIIIEVASILEEEPKENLYEGDFTLEKNGMNFYWNIYFYVLLLLTIIGLLIILIKVLKKKKKVTTTTKEIFIERLSLLNSQSPNYLHQLSECFMDYLEEKLQVNLKIKKGLQVMDVFVNIHEDYKDIPYLSWSEKIEYYKFSGQVPSVEIKEELSHSVYKMIDLIEAIYSANYEAKIDVENEKSEVKV